MSTEISNNLASSNPATPAKTKGRRWGMLLAALATGFSGGVAATLCGEAKLAQDHGAAYLSMKEADLTDCMQKEMDISPEDRKALARQFVTLSTMGSQKEAMETLMTGIAKRALNQCQPRILPPLNIDNMSKEGARLLNYEKAVRNEADAGNDEL